MNKETKPLFDRLRKALCTNVFTDLKEDFTDTALIEHSMTGRSVGYDGFVKLFSYQGPGEKCVKTNFENIIVRENAINAAYSFHLLRQYCEWDAHQFMHYLHYGATVVVKMKKEGPRWKISQVIFELTWIDGNTAWLNGQTLIDYRVPRVEPKLIQAKEDGVVHIVTLDIDTRSDLEKIVEIVFIYGWFVDYEDYEAFEKVSVDQLRIIDGFHNQVIESRDAWISFVKTLHTKESFLFHTYHITSYEILGEKACVRMSRVEPNRIGSKVINQNNYWKDWFTMDLIMDLVKQKDGTWKLVQAELIKNIRPVATNGFLYKEKTV